jgi:hypothetical protein
MVSLLPLSVVDHGFIGGVMVSLLPSSVPSTKLISSHLNLTCSRHDIAEKLLTWY